MTEPSESPRNEAAAEWIIKLIAFAGGGLVGAVIGGMFISQIARAFLGPVPYLWQYCALGLGLLVGLSSYRKAAKQVARQRQTGEVAEQMGLEQSTDREDELEETLSEIFSGAGHLSVGNVVWKDIGSSRLAIADLERTHRSSSSSSSSSHCTTRSIAFLESPETSWPSFTLQPEGMALGLLTKLVGVQDIDFADFQAFSDSYYLTGARPDLVREFFTPDLLHFFTENPGLEVRADENHLVLVKSGKPCEPDELEAFLEFATAVFTQLITASVQTAATRAALEANAPSSAAASEQMSGVVGAMMRRMLVMPDQLQAFLSEMPPRQIPGNIKRRRMDSGSLVAAIGGGLLFLAGSCFGIYSAFFAEGPWDINRVVPLAFGIFFPLIGFPVCVLTVRYRYINKRLLRHGVVTNATVLAVVKTDVSINRQQQYRMEVRFQTRMGEQQAQCNVYGRIGREAQPLAESNRSTRILYDPRKPSRILWTESLLLESVV